MSTIGEQPMMRRLHGFLRRNGFLLLFLHSSSGDRNALLGLSGYQGRADEFSALALDQASSDGHPFVGLANFRAVFSIAWILVITQNHSGIYRCDGCGALRSGFDSGPLTE